MITESEVNTKPKINLNDVIENIAILLTKALQLAYALLRDADDQFRKVDDILANIVHFIELFRLAIPNRPPVY